MTGFIENLYHNLFLKRIFHTLIYCLERELRGCRTVLDVGCGPNSPIKYCQDIEHSLGVEPFEPYLKESKKRGIHGQYVSGKIENLEFPKKSFDAVVMLEVLEHLDKESGKKVLKKASGWAKEKVIVSTPNGFFPMGEVDNNPFQKHLSGWTVKEFSRLGFKCYGLAGIKFFYFQNNQVESLINEGEAASFSNIRFKPKRLFYIINSLFQIFSYYLPEISFELLAIKNV